MNIEKIRNRLKSCRNCKPYENEGYKDCLICVEHNRFRFDPEIQKELDELEAKAAKWDDTQTQANLELAAAVKWANTVIQNFFAIDNIIELYREQKGGSND